jgi:hypothetical protein
MSNTESKCKKMDSSHEPKRSHYEIMKRMRDGRIKSVMEVKTNDKHPRFAFIIESDSDKDSESHKSDSESSQKLSDSESDIEDCDSNKYKVDGVSQPKSDISVPLVQNKENGGGNSAEDDDDDNSIFDQVDQLCQRSIDGKSFFKRPRVFECSSEDRMIVNRKDVDNIRSPICVCEAQRMEAVWNNELPHIFTSQKKHDTYVADRRDSLLEKQILESSNFLIGNHMRVTIALFDDEVAPMCVGFIISHGKNTLHCDAIPFLTNGVENIQYGITSQVFHDDPSVEMDIAKTGLFAEFYQDSLTSWFILRQYMSERSYVSNRLYISIESWIEIKKLIPTFITVAEHYTDLFLQGRTKHCYPTDTEEIKKKRYLQVNRLVDCDCVMCD